MTGRYTRDFTVSVPSVIVKSVCGVCANKGYVNLSPSSMGWAYLGRHDTGSHIFHTKTGGLVYTLSKSGLVTVKCNCEAGRKLESPYKEL